MAAWQWLADSAGVVLLLLGAYGAVLVVRRRVLARHGGTFELSVRSGASEPESGRGWVLGLGRYRADSLQWFRVFTPSPRPRRQWARVDLEVVGQRSPSGAERHALYEGHLIVECATPDGRVELAMSPSALTGFSSWLEAGPPGTDWTQRPTR